jgi:hypothetical protein
VLFGLLIFSFVFCIVYIFGHPNYSYYNAKKFLELTGSNLFFVFVFGIFVFKYFFRTMSSSSSQCRVHRRTKTDLEATRARVEHMQVIIEGNVVRADVMVPPFSFID